MTGGVTVRELAAAAGVSVGTVSRALKNQTGVSEATRRHVREVARRLGYEYGRLRTTKARRLTFLLHRQHSGFTENPFFAQVLQGVESACRAADMVPTLLACGPTDPVRDQLRLHEPDVLLAAGFFEAEMITMLAGLDRPLALIDHWMPGLPSVNPDNARGGYEATCHLLARGCRRIAYIASSLAHYSIRERALGYRRALFEAGVLADPALELVLAPGVEIAAGCEAAVQQLLKLRQPPDAIFVYNDAAALAVLAACRMTGLRVPEDLAVVGFDDIPGAAAAGLSTLRVDKEGLGQAGVDLLLHLGQRPVETVLPAVWVGRASA